MRRAVDFFLDNRWLVIGLLLALIVGGIATMLRLPLEAFPDLTNNQVVVTVAPIPGFEPALPSQHLALEHLTTSR